MYTHEKMWVKWPGRPGLKRFIDVVRRKVQLFLQRLDFGRLINSVPINVCHLKSQWVIRYWLNHYIHMYTIVRSLTLRKKRGTQISVHIILKEMRIHYNIYDMASQKGQLVFSSVVRNQCHKIASSKYTDNTNNTPIILKSANKKLLATNKS